MPEQGSGIDDELYDLADEPTGARTNTAPANPAAVPAANANTAAGQVIAYRGKHLDETPELDTDKLQHEQAPLCLAAGGIVVEFLAAWWEARAGGVREALTQVSIQILLNTALLMLVMFLVARTRGFKFGKFNTAFLQLMAVAVAPSALMTVLSLLLFWLPLGFLAVWVIGFCTYFALLGFFFDLDQDDTWYCVIAIFLTQVAMSLVFQHLL